MITHIEWHKTSEELPKQSCYKVGVNAKTYKELCNYLKKIGEEWRVE